MFVTDDNLIKDYTLADLYERLRESPLPYVVYTKDNVVSVNDIVTYNIIVEDFDYTYTIIFDDGNGNITTQNALESFELTAQYNANGLYGPKLTSYNTLFPNVKYYADYDNMVWVNEFTPIYYDVDKTRQLLSSLSLPHTKEELNIHPSDFVKDKTFNNVVDLYFENLDYLLEQSSIYSQSLFVGWFKWFNGDNWVNGYPYLETTSLSSIVDLIKIDGYIFTIENNKIVAREEDYNGTIFKTYEYITEIEKFVEPIKMQQNGYHFFVLDKGKNGFFDFEFSNTYDISLSLNFGGKGRAKDKYRFNSPNDFLYNSDGLYIADTENKAVKVYNKKFHWKYGILMDYKPMKLECNEQYLFVLCDDNKIRVYDKTDGTYKTTYSSSINNIYNIHLDEINDNLLYVFGENEIGLYDENEKFISYSETEVTIKGVWQEDNTFYGYGDNFFAKYVDYLTTNDLYNTEISANFWSKEEIYMNPLEYSQHFVYNDSFKKMLDNLELFVKSVTKKVTNYYDFKGRFLYQSISDMDEDYSCDFTSSYIGVNEIESYDVLTREWNKIWDLMDCVLDFITTRKKHLDPENDCVTWGDGTTKYNKETNTIVWPLNWEELNCDNVELTGTIMGILPQHWTWAQLMCIRKNAPTFNELVGEPVSIAYVDTWAEMENNLYVWESMEQNSALELTYDDVYCENVFTTPTWTDVTDVCANIVINPSPNTWRNIGNDCCSGVTFNTIPYDWEEELLWQPKYSWNTLTCLDQALTADDQIIFSFNDLSCTDEFLLNPFVWMGMAEGSAYEQTWEMMEVSGVSATKYENLQCTEEAGEAQFLSWNFFVCDEDPIHYFETTLIIEDEC